MAFRKTYLKNKGYCPICESKTNFVAKDPWLRDHYICRKCRSIPRERALMEAINTHFPNWRDATVHESSPANRGVSVRLKNECQNYISSQYLPGEEYGQLVNGVRNENLESLSFSDNSIDLHITQDVIEHIFNPEDVFKEIARTLTPGGMHIFTVPLVKKWEPSSRRAKLDEKNNVTHLVDAEYHGNPVGDGRSLVTIDWGYDITGCIFHASGLFTQIIHMDNIDKGIRAEYIEVLVTQKPADNASQKCP